jgi:hypothetical protein
MISVFELQNAVKGATIPVQAWRGLESSRRLRLEDCRQSAHEDGKVVSLTHYHTSQEIFLVFIPVIGRVDPGEIVRQDGLCH